MGTICINILNSELWIGPEYGLLFVNLTNAKHFTLLLLIVKQIECASVFVNH